ncbi:MAG: hypothetical protein K9K65_14580 [Desulfarculaceae bacterium]|nr:hypothetical protein [Desulfarculaceae bacterium]MCF8048964.1 hypothetical protein [Desulfarculaceae bacterium]MCF8065245.1 hypothetical protein [Desulfarculaceae bacterium]MCF8099065.1 hypothetical protein [Desulfarculaceae bacterium]
MDPVYWLLEQADPFLISPYRWLSDPSLGWWLGTAVLCLWCTILGEATYALVKRLNRAHMQHQLDQMTEGQANSLEALRAGDKLAYKGFNDQANDSFGKSFFMGMAMGSSSLWPAFLAMAWLQWRFGEVRIPFPGAGWSMNFSAGFIPMYIIMRVLWSLGRKWLRRPAPAPSSSGK